MTALAAASVVGAASIPAGDLTGGWKIAGPFGGTATTVAVDPKNPSTILAGAMNSLLYQSQDSGTTWIPLNLPKRTLGEVTSILVDPNDASHYLVGVLDALGGGLFESVDAGKSWAPTPAIQNVGVRALAVSVSNPAEFVAGTLQGVMLSKDSGKTWQRISDPDNLEMQGITAIAIDPKNADVIYAGTPHLPWRTNDAGKTWQSIHSGMIDDSDVFSIYVNPRSSDSIFASACSGIYMSGNRGESWKKLAGIPNTSRRTHVIREDPMHDGMIFAGTTMGLFRSPNAGTNWKSLTATQVNALAFDPAQPTSFYLAMQGEGIGKTQDGGDTIKLMDTGFVDRQIASMTRAGKQLFAIEPDGGTTGVFVSDDNGSSWDAVKNVSGLAGVFLRSVVGDPLADVKKEQAALQASKTALRGRPVARKTAPVAPGTTLLAATSQQIYRSADGGAHWLPLALKESVTLPPLPVKTPQRRTVGARNRVEAPARPRIQIKPFLPSDIGGLYVVQNGEISSFVAATNLGLYFSEDLGSTWQRSAIPAEGTVVGLYPSPAHDGRLVARTAGALYTSKNGGKAWERWESAVPARDIYSIALPGDPAAPVLIATRTGLLSADLGGDKWFPSPAPLQASTVTTVTYLGAGKVAYAAQFGELFKTEDSGTTWVRQPSELHELPIRQLWNTENGTSRLFAITSGLGILFRE